MVGAGNDGELLLGFTADGLFEIVLRQGKFFFRKKILCQIFFLCQFLKIGLMYRDLSKFFFL